MVFCSTYITHLQASSVPYTVICVLALRKHYTTTGTAMRVLLQDATDNRTTHTQKRQATQDKNNLPVVLHLYCNSYNVAFPTVCTHIYYFSKKCVVYVTAFHVTALYLSLSTRFHEVRQTHTLHTDLRV
jgi:hypothetical protein